MDTIFNASLIGLTILYTLLVTTYARIFTRGAGGLALHVRPLLAGTVFLHVLSILLRSIQIGACPLGSRPEVLSLVAFSIGLIYLILELRIRERVTGIFALTPAFVLQVIAAIDLLGRSETSGRTLGMLESLHTFAAIVGFSAVSICGVYGLLYLFLYGAIKRGRFGLFYRKMPSLETLGDLNFVATLTAFVALSVAVGLGFWLRFRLPEMGVSLVEPEVLLTSLLWLLYGGCILGKRFFHLGGKRLAYTTALGLFLLLGIFIGAFLKLGFHG